MTLHRAPVTDSQRTTLPDIKLLPAVASLRNGVPFERRNVALRNSLLSRIRSEFREMPGLSLTVNQGAKLFGVSPDVCSRIFVRLAQECWLQVRRDDRYVLFSR